MHERVVGLLPCIKQEMERPPVLAPLDGCREEESARSFTHGKESRGRRTSLPGEDLVWVLRMRKRKSSFTFLSRLRRTSCCWYLHEGAGPLLKQARGEQVGDAPLTSTEEETVRRSDKVTHTRVCVCVTSESLRW